MHDVIKKGGRVWKTINTQSQIASRVLKAAIYVICFHYNLWKKIVESTILFPLKKLFSKKYKEPRYHHHP